MNKKIIGQAMAISMFLSLILSCNQNYFYSSETIIPDGVWNDKKAAVFIPDFKDSTQNYNLILSVTNSDDYRYSNLWFFINTISPDGFLHKDTIEVILAEENGKWKGKKDGDYRTAQFYFKKMVRFPKTGKYTFEIIHGMRDNNLKGIEKIGLLIEDNNQN
ncbi:MAG: gliding motility lipoprotein GldH [Bacteroidales bacterium]|nr:gliding motility lipoprotein GldH [Bacteroidales bacterium]